MQKKKRYNCTVCNTEWECYVYDEFITPFSICLYCLMDVEEIFRKKNKIIETCILCDTSKECNKIPLSNNPVKSEIFICNDCFQKMKTLIKEKVQ
ncbi:MAG: hypothetical protein KatS3mg002_1521 [Candidatus Woesearchaeota archaeon]|nr:MAG: hypothetical protein KatS3mg002_1521 [Candidatus Woesearchaeota archaeon]